MRIVILAHHHFPLDEVAAALWQEGIEAFSCRLETTQRALDLPQDAGLAVAVIPEPEIVKIGEQAKQLQKLLAPQMRLILCVRQLTVRDRQLLEGYGVSNVISPVSFTVGSVVERISAEVTLSGGLEPSSFGRLHGATKDMRSLYSEIETLAGLKEPVLILGETGTGKELVAGEIHRCSGRSKPFLKLNCAEFSPELLRSELFGHTKGSFTGAYQAKDGLMAEAGNGTLFLDEIGELDLQAQAMLLRVLGEREFRAIGATKWQEFNARLVLATHRNLEEAVDEGKFRRDLFARINDFTLYLPPLRERRADIPLLVHHFIESFNVEYPDRRSQIPSGALDCLFQGEWPENVRQLRKVIWKAATFRDSDGNISVVCLQEAVGRIEKRKPRYSISFDPASDTWRMLQRRVQSVYFRALLAYTKNNKEAAIRISGLSRSHFYERLKELDRDDLSDQLS